MGDSVELSETPTFTVVVRTQGTRPLQLAEALESIRAGFLQPAQVIVVVHGSRHSEVRASVKRFQGQLPIEIYDVAAGTRAAPLAAAVPYLRGSHVVFLDDDDLALPAWLSAFADALGSTSQRIGARARALVQSWEVTADISTGSRPVGEAEDLYPKSFELFDHLILNRTPFMSVAFPTTLFRDQSIVVDEQLVVCEDWDLILQLAFATEVIEVPEATSIYRRWVDVETSYSLHDASEWAQSEERVRNRLASRSMQLTTERLQRLIELIKLAEEESELRAAKEHWENVQRSRSWRFLRRLRGAN